VRKEGGTERIVGYVFEEAHDDSANTVRTAAGIARNWTSRKRVLASGYGSGSVFLQGAHKKELTGSRHRVVEFSFVWVASEDRDQKEE